jgi:hypothetical protein
MLVVVLGTLQKDEKIKVFSDDDGNFKSETRTVLKIE